MTFRAKRETMRIMPNLLEEEEDKVMFSIPLDGATIDRLMHLSNICHADPIAVAASLLHDILKDDEVAHAIEGAVDDHRATKPKPTIN